VAVRLTSDEVALLPEEEEEEVDRAINATRRTNGSKLVFAVKVTTENRHFILDKSPDLTT